MTPESQSRDKNVSRPPGAQTSGGFVRAVPGRPQESLNSNPSPRFEGYPGMLYSTYRYGSVIFYAVVIGLLGGWVMTQSVGLGILFILGFALLGLLLFWVHFALMRARLDDYDGRIPMPNLGLGMWGVNVVDDDVAEAGSSSSGSAGHTLGEQPTTRLCPHCMAPVMNENAKFCDTCGKPL